MPETLDFFSSIEYLEPRCPKCGSVLEYGINTRYNEKKGAHICLSCNAVLG